MIVRRSLCTAAGLILVSNFSNDQPFNDIHCGVLDQLCGVALGAKRRARSPAIFILSIG